MIEDRDIIERCKAGQMDLIDILIERYKTPLYRYCCYLTQSKLDADDIFQETWIKVVKNIYSFDSSNKFCPWLYTISLNIYRDNYRLGKRWLNRIKTYLSNELKDNEINSVADNSLPPDDQIIEIEMKKRLRLYINKLEDIYRIPLILFYFEDMSYKEVSEILKIPLGTVKSRLNTGKATLRKLMEEG